MPPYRSDAHRVFSFKIWLQSASIWTVDIFSLLFLVLLFPFALLGFVVALPVSSFCTGFKNGWNW
jgi:hypothetical protein